MKGTIVFPDHLIPYIKQLINDDFGTVSWLSFYNKEPEFRSQEYYDFVKCARESSVLFSASYYFNNCERILELSDDGILTCQFSMKNYDNELEKFIKWLRTSNITYNLKTRYEECDVPTIHINKRK